MAKVTVTVPDIGDAEDVEVIELCVSQGDAVEEGDAILVIESDKASMEVPAPSAGTVDKLLVDIGALLNEGDAIAELSAAGDADAQQSTADAVPDAVSESVQETEVPAAQEPEEKSVVADQAEAGSPESVEVRVPDVGDASEVTVVEICVAVGDEVSEGDSLVVLESDKASMEIPATVDGVIESIDLADGQEIAEGDLVATIASTSGGATSETAGQTKAAQSSAPPAGSEKEPTPPAAVQKSSAPPTPAASQNSGSATDSDAKKSSAKSDAQVYAGPAVRRMARELGVELSEVTGSGAKGRIVKEDLQAHVKSVMQGGAKRKAGTDAGAAGIPPIPLPDFTRFGEIEVEKMSRVMRAGGQNLHRSWLNLPHVTHFEEADVTDLEAFRKSLKAEGEKLGVKMTPLAFLVMASVQALKAFPYFNSSLDENQENFILKKYYNIGIAVDTPKGLVVPVVKQADQKGAWDIARDIIDLSGRARDMKLKPDEMQGGTFSISSLGVLGGTAFTPIINAPEVAILGAAKLAKRPVWDGQQFVPRDMLPISLSYDHRAINGAAAARFMTYFKQLLEDPRHLLL